MECVQGMKHSVRQTNLDDFSSTRHPHLSQQEVCKEIMRRLTEAGCEAMNCPNFTDDLQAHFNRLPNRYTLDVNTERAEDVLLHRRLLQLAEIPANRPVFHVRSAQVISPVMEGGEELSVPTASSQKQESHNDSLGSTHQKLKSPNIGDLAIDGQKPCIIDEGQNSDDEDSTLSPRDQQVFAHEVIFSTIDKTKLLSQLSSILADLGLNIREAHVYSTTDGYSLDVFVVEGWPREAQCRAQELLTSCHDVVRAQKICNTLWGVH
eukprot:c26222_g1_i1 orf=2530-3321(-)